MLNIVIGDEMHTRVVNALCGQYGRPDKVRTETGEVDNPVSPDDFALNVINSFIQEVTVNYESNLIAIQAKKDAIAQVKASFNQKSIQATATPVI